MAQKILAVQTLDRHGGFLLAAHGVTAPTIAELARRIGCSVENIEIVIKEAPRRRGPQMAHGFDFPIFG